MNRPRLAPEAADDLESIWLRLEEISPAVARRTIRAILARVEQLGEMPRSGHRRSELPGDLRALHVRGWLILYGVVEDTAIVV